MSRIKYPVDFSGKANLFLKIELKHANDGDKSVLIDFLEEKKIDMAKNKKKTESAVVTHAEFVKTSEEAEELTQKRDNFWNPVFSNFKKEIQYLKSFYRGKVKELGMWGIKVDGKGKVVYPAKFEDLVKMFAVFYKKHTAMGAKSPLIKFLTENEIDIDSDKKNADSALKAHGEMTQEKKDAEKLRNQRDTDFNPVFADVLAIGQFLKKLFTANPHKLGDWGFEIDDSPPKPRKKKGNNPSA
ncbi:MAG: hypothetical protein HY841_03120 [Bacteroidetes bacterium]|nr:hypothetical protein [Bacteroidota bacterium]